MKKLAIVTSHPIQYNAPLFRELQKNGKICIKVFYTWSQSAEGPKFDPGFGRKIDWDIPLLAGYDHTFVNNVATDPGTHHFKGIVNPTLNEELQNWMADCILIYGWSFQSHLKCIRFFSGKVPIIFRGDSTLLAEHPGLKKLVRTIFLKWVYRHVDYVLYVGKNNKQYYLRHGVKEHQLFFAPHAIDNSRFDEDKESVEKKALAWRKELGILDNEMVFMFAGKLELKKNSQFLIKSFSSINNPATHLIILGNGPVESKLKKQYSQVKNLHFIDFQNQSQMPVAYRLCDVFVLPSKGPVETWGLAVNEAMACSKAVLVSRVCGCAADLVVDGVNGYIFNSHKKRDLIDKMKHLIANKHEVKAMGDRSWEMIQPWSFKNIREQIENTVAQLG